MDKLHINGHTEQWCLGNCHLEIFTELKYVKIELPQNKIYILNGFSQNFSEFSEKPIFFTFFKKSSKSCFWSIWKEHHKLGGEGAFELTKTYFSESIQNL